MQLILNQPQQEFLMKMIEKPRASKCRDNIPIKCIKTALKSEYSSGTIQYSSYYLYRVTDLLSNAWAIFDSMSL